MIKVVPWIGTAMTLPRTAQLCLLAFSLLLSGCGTLDREKKSTALEAATSGYGRAMRWGYYESAYGYLHPANRVKPPTGVDNVRLTAYEIVQPPLRTNPDAAEQVVHIEYVLADEQVVRKLTDRQDWRYDEKTRSWWLHSAPPDFR